MIIGMSKDESITCECGEFGTERDSENVRGATFCEDSGTSPGSSSGCIGELSIIGNLGGYRIDRSILMRSCNRRSELGHCSTVIVERAVEVLDQI